MTVAGSGIIGSVSFITIDEALYDTQIAECRSLYHERQYQSLL